MNIIPLDKFRFNKKENWLAINDRYINQHKLWNHRPDDQLAYVCIKSHVTGKEYIFVHDGKALRFSGHSKVDYWTFKAADESCPVKVVYILDQNSDNVETFVPNGETS